MANAMAPKPLRPVGSPPPPYPPRRGRGLWHSITHAWRGLIHTVVHQRNMRIHVVSGILVGLVGSGIPLGLAEKVTLIFCVLLMFFAEILNSALEQLVDLAVEQLNEKARLTKDAAAAGVLVLGIGTVVIFAAVLVSNWQTVTSHQFQIQRQVLLGVPFSICAGVLMVPSISALPLKALAFVTGCVLLTFIWIHAESHVFAAMTWGLFIVAVAAAHDERRASEIAGRAANKDERPSMPDPPGRG